MNDVQSAHQHSVSVTTGCRIHFGLAEIAADEPNRYAGLGLALDNPGFEVSAQLVSGPDTLAGESFVQVDTARGLSGNRNESVPPEVVQRMQRVASNVAQACLVEQPELTQSLDGKRVVLACHALMPLHHGLGAGTQLALAVTAAVQRVLLGEKPAFQHDSGSWQTRARRLAQLSRRGKRSAIGIASFCAGGLVLDNGYLAKSEEAVRPIACESVALPQAWRVVLAFPETPPGLTGQIESAAMRAVARSSNPNRAEMLTLARCIAEIASRGDYESFTSVLEQYLNLASELFAPVQGGPYNGAEIASAVDRCRTAGLRAVGQSSWGPCVFGFAQDDASAKQAMEMLRDSAKLKAWISKPATEGAVIK